VILLEVDTLGIPGVKFECDGPRSVYMDRVARRVEPKQSVKVEAWQVHIFRNRSSRESIQPAKNARLETSVNPGPLALPQVLELFVPKQSYHGSM